MPKTLKSVSKGYSHNLNYSLSPRRFESIIKVLENSRDNLSKAHVAHVVLQVDDEKFNKSLINEVLKQALEEIRNWLWLLHCIEKERKINKSIIWKLSY